MKVFRNLLAMMLALSLLCVPVLAAEGFNAGLTVDRSKGGAISVTVADSTRFSPAKALAAGLW